MMNLDNRMGMSGRAWNLALGLIEILSDLIKGFTFVGGVIAASVADWVMGAISMSILFGANTGMYTKTPVWVISAALSMGASAFQIYLFAVLQKRKIGVKQLLAFKKLDKEVQSLVGITGLLWLVDTFTDVAPILLLVRDSQYKAIPELWYIMIAAAVFIVFVLCGFSELVTSNMRGVLQINPQHYASRPATVQSNQPRQSQPQQNQQQQSHRHNNTPARNNNQPVRNEQQTQTRRVPAEADEITSYLRSRH